VPFNELLIDSNASKNKLESIKDKIFKDKQTVLVMRQDHPSVSMFINEVKQMKAMQAVFPIVFLLIAILTTLTTMTRITMNQRTQIGTFKAIGFPNKKILLHYMSYGAFIGTLGGLLGLTSGPILLPAIIFRFQKGFYSMPEWKGTMEPAVFLVAFLCIAGCGLSGLLACRKELHGAAAEILRPKAPKVSKHTGLEKSKQWNSLKFDFQWNIRDLLRNKVRSFITIIGIIGCMALIICALGMRDTVRGMTNTSYKELNAYATKVTLDESITKERLQELQEDKKLQFIQETAIEIDMNNEKETTMLTVIGEGSYIKHKDNNNNFISLPEDGVAITNKVAKHHNLKVGDLLKWRIYGTDVWITADIKAIIRNPVSQGVYVSEEAYKELDQRMFPTAFVTNEDGRNYTGEEFSFIQTSEELVKSMDTLMETMNAMIAILIMAAIILGVVVLYNLGVLSFNERIRELTTLKVLGFQYEKLRKLLQMQNIWLTLLGAFIGAPSGYLLLSYMLQFMGDSFDMLPGLSIFSLGFSVLGTLLLSIVVNWCLCHKIKTIDMVSALKSVE
jgi:putative ABC transport system permease protein